MQSINSSRYSTSVAVVSSTYSAPRQATRQGSGRCLLSGGGFGCPRPHPLRRSPLSGALGGSFSAVRIGTAEFRPTKGLEGHLGRSAAPEIGALGASLSRVLASWPVGLWVGKTEAPLRQHQTLTLGFRYWIAKLSRGINPESHRFIDIPESGVLRVSMSHTARKLWNFGHESTVCVAPIEK